MFVTHPEFEAWAQRMERSHAELATEVKLIPERIEEKRRQDRIRFWRNLFALVVGVATIVAAITGIVALILQILHK